LIDAASLGRLFALERVVLLNDLEATAYGIAVLPPEQLVVLNPVVPRPGGNAALIAAGTGLGEAVVCWVGTRHRVWASEAGLADGQFMRALTAKSLFADWLVLIPVKVILDPKTALRGAAAYLASVEARS